jgi:hypothetical protein
MKYPLVLLQDKLNEGLAKQVRWAVDTRSLDDPHVKTNLLLQVVCNLQKHKLCSHIGVLIGCIFIILVYFEPFALFLLDIIMYM